MTCCCIINRVCFSLLVIRSVLRFWDQILLVTVLVNCLLNSSAFSLLLIAALFPNLKFGFGSGLGFLLKSPAIVFHNLCDLRFCTSPSQILSVVSKVLFCVLGFVCLFLDSVMLGLGVWDFAVG